MFVKSVSNIPKVQYETICNSLVEITRNYDKRDEIANCARILADRLAEKSVDNEQKLDLLSLQQLISNQ